MFHLVAIYSHAVYQTKEKQDENFKVTRTPCNIFRWPPDYQRLRFGVTCERQRCALRYLVYSWAITHMMGISTLMILGAQIFMWPKSLLDRVNDWKVWALFVFLFLTWAWMQFRNERMGNIQEPLMVSFPNHVRAGRLNRLLGRDPDL